MNAAQPTSADLGAVVTDVMERLRVPGIAIGIWRDGTVESHGYGVASLDTGQPVRPDTLFQIGSISKIFTATLVMRLVDDGLLDLDTPVTRYVPDLRLADDDALRTITLRHLLSHTSGLEGDRFTDYGLGDDALGRGIAELHSLRQLTRPGELWAYCNNGFNLAGYIVQQVLGQPFEAAMRERLFEPLGLERAFYFAHEAIVYPGAVWLCPTAPGSDQHEVSRPYPLPRWGNPAGGIISTTADLLRFAAFHLGDGVVNGKRILSAEAIAAMQVPQTRAANFAEAYGIGWALDTVDGVKVVSHGGSTNGFQAHLDLIPEKRFAIAILTNSSRGAAAYREIIDWAFEHECGLRRELPTPITLPPDELAWFAGTYRRPNASLTLSVDGQRLRADRTTKSELTGEEVTQPPVLLTPIGEREFLITDGDLQGARVDLIPDANDKPRFVRFGGRLAYWIDPEAGDDAPGS